jgi:hypothetical protein
MKLNLVPVAKINKVIPDFPVARATLYKWRTQKIHPNIFVRFAGRLFVDMDKLDEVMEAGRGK